MTKRTHVPKSSCSQFLAWGGESPLADINSMTFLAFSEWAWNLPGGSSKIEFEGNFKMNSRKARSKRKLMAKQNVGDKTNSS